MTATIHDHPRKPDLIGQFLKENGKHQVLWHASKTFVERVHDHAMTNGDSYLAQAAREFLAGLGRVK